jgi:hypothetical protein
MAERTASAPSICPGRVGRVIPEQKAKALVAGSVAVFVVGLVILLLLVIPAARRGQVASAQDAAEPAEAEIPEEPGAEAGFEGAPGGPPGAAPTPALVPIPADREPLEAYRPNPFAPRAAAGGVGEEVRAARAFRYGPDWSDVPIGESTAFTLPVVPKPPTPLPPMIRPGAAELLRVTSIMWGADGQALAAYETPDGQTGVLKPGDRVQGWTVTEIRRNGVVLRSAIGEIQQIELRARTERPEPERPTRPTRPGRQPRQPTPGGRRPPTRVPAEPPG